MKKNLLLLLIIFFPASKALAQQIPFGSCGYVCVYDAAGNRTKRVYFCNNGLDPYPGFSNIDNQFVQNQNKSSFEFQPVEALYPNPTSGKFSIVFSKALSNASISILDANGKAVQQIKTSGGTVNFDLSGVASGTYFVRIEENGKIITKKVIKQ